MIRRPDLIDFKYVPKKRSKKKMNSSFYKNRGGINDVERLTPFRGTQDSKGFQFERNGSAEEIPRDTIYDDDDDPYEDEVERSNILANSKMHSPVAH